MLWISQILFPAVSHCLLRSLSNLCQDLSGGCPSRSTVFSTGWSVCWTLLKLIGCRMLPAGRPSPARAAGPPRPTTPRSPRRPRPWSRALWRILRLMKLRRQVRESDTRVQGWLVVAMLPLPILLPTSTLLALALRNEPGLSEAGFLALPASLLMVFCAGALTSWVYCAS